MNWILKFPPSLTLNPGSVVDDAIRQFSRNHRASLSAIKNVTVWMLSAIERCLELIPWWALILLVVWAGYKVSGKKKIGVLYGAMLFFVGCFGLWTMMLETLSLIIVSVTLALALGFPLGVLVAMNRHVETVMQPAMDFMQTIPSFVYLIPAAMLFSVGKTPAVMATLIYSVVPMIRLTSHGIRHVDKEVVEAGIAFGSTRLQLLFNVQVPQALPTIMTGINQTIMMAMGMVVTCALIGANGLGMEILVATNRTEMGRALMPGISIVFIAIILDRLTRGSLTQGSRTQGALRGSSDKSPEKGEVKDGGNAG
ncbi:MAG: ABC transporter permease subunit [Synergistaceae bacterium]|jgi:glycine betaine/proline transport system permease protein/glycine betaine/proline transport system substrate-binding protein|nr:ABC transporter permease subunit [Synergistaceae bacterium]